MSLETDPDLVNHGEPRATRRRWAVPIAAFVLLVGGVFALNYPDMSNWVNQARFNQLVQGVKQQTMATDPATVTRREAALRAAHDYNDQLSSGALIAANERIPLGAAEITPQAHALYESLLSHDPGGIMASINIPAINTELPIYHGTSDETLLKGVGHLEGTSLPVGGVGTHAVLTAHRGLASAKLFTDLDRVRAGDDFLIVVEGEVLDYRVISTQVVEPSDTAAIRPDPSKDLVTLVTCTPLGVNSHRILVTGERVIPTPKAAEDAGRGAAPMPFPWWAVWDGAALVVGTAYLRRAGFAPSLLMLRR